MEKVGIVTITYNSQEVIKQFLDSVLNQSHKDFLLYIIDNNSQDRTLEIINSYKDERIKLISNNKNFGVAKGNNQGINLSIENNCEYILLLNNDTEFEIDLLKKMLSVRNKNKCSLVAPKILYFDHPNHIWYAGSRFQRRKGILPIHNGNMQQDIGQFDTCSQTEYAPTCCLLIDIQVFLDIGMMDETYFVYFDDTDFLYRILIDGRHKLFYFSDVVFYHKVGSLTSSFYKSGERTYRGDFFIKQNTRNHVYFLKKTRTIFGYLFIFFLFFKNNLRFLFSSYIRKDFKTFYLINRSYLQGLFMKECKKD